MMTDGAAGLAAQWGVLWGQNWTCRPLGEDLALSGAQGSARHLFLRALVALRAAFAGTSAPWTFSPPPRKGEAGAAVTESARAHSYILS